MFDRNFKSATHFSIYRKASEGKRELYSLYKMNDDKTGWLFYSRLSGEWIYSANPKDFFKNISTSHPTLERGDLAEIRPDLCKCSTCGTTYKISECNSVTDHHNGWELPVTTELECPKCSDGGCIEDYFFSEEFWE